MAVLVIAPIVIEEINSDYTPGALCGPPRRMGVVAGVAVLVIIGCWGSIGPPWCSFTPVGWWFYVSAFCSGVVSAEVVSPVQP